MGFNFSGLVIGKSYKNKPKDFMNEVGQYLRLSDPEEINYEMAEANWKDEGLCDVYFGDKGTILYTADPEVCIDPWLQEDVRAMSFVYLEMSMFFNMVLSENKQVIRKISEENGEIKHQSGEPLPFEAELNNEPSSLIFRLINTILAQPGGVDPEEIAYRYQMPI